jgi:hypothetical protein
VLELDWFHVFNANHARYMAGEHERDAQSFSSGSGNSEMAIWFSISLVSQFAAYSPYDWNIFLVPHGFGSHICGNFF